MRTNYCPHCGSDRIHKVVEDDGEHYHECDDCHEAWKHCDSEKHTLIGTHELK